MSKRAIFGAFPTFTFSPLCMEKKSSDFSDEKFAVNAVNECTSNTFNNLAVIKV
jgi:hypothetical protein